MSANTMLAVGLVVCAVVVVVAIAASNMMHKEPPPAPPPPPPPPEASVTKLLRYSPSYYKGILDEDVQKFGIPKVEPAEMAKPLTYSLELSTPKRMKADKDRLETAHLSLQTKVSKQWATTGSGEGFRYEHAMLEITNKSNRPVAYKVETSVEGSKKCNSMGANGQNAIALGPNEKVTRSECLWGPGMGIIVRRVEVVELNSPLSYYYVSRLPPNLVLMDERTALGHTPPKGKTCNFIPGRDIQPVQGGPSPAWDDVVDFYARHSCDEYSFWRGYKRWKAPGELPSFSPAKTAPKPDAPPTTP